MENLRFEEEKIFKDMKLFYTNKRTKLHCN